MPGRGSEINCSPPFPKQSIVSPSREYCGQVNAPGGEGELLRAKAIQRLWICRETDKSSGLSLLSGRKSSEDVRDLGGVNGSGQRATL